MDRTCHHFNMKCAVKMSRQDNQSSSIDNFIMTADKTTSMPFRGSSLNVRPNHGLFPHWLEAGQGAGSTHSRSFLQSSSVTPSDAFSLPKRIEEDFMYTHLSTVSLTAPTHLSRPCVTQVLAAWTGSELLHHRAGAEKDHNLSLIQDTLGTSFAVDARSQETLTTMSPMMNQSSSWAARPRRVSHLLPNVHRTKVPCTRQPTHECKADASTDAQRTCGHSRPAGPDSAAFPSSLASQVQSSRNQYGVLSAHSTCA